MYYCPNCNADLEDQFGFDPSNGTWTCTECGQFLMDDDIADGDTYDGVAWFCDNCNALLNRQSGFSDSYGTWTCTECGHINGISDEDIIEDEHKCPNCGANLKKQWDYSEYTNDYTCSECGSVLHRDYSSDEFSVIADEDICPNCGAYLKSQWGFSTYDDDWTCTECNAELHREYSSDPFSTVEDEHKCPNCGTSLLKQSGYSEYCYDWTCSECDSELHRDYSGSEFSVVESDDSDSDYDDDEDDDEYESDSDTSYDNYSSPQSFYDHSESSPGYSSTPRYSSPISNTSSYNRDYSTQPSILPKSEVRKKRIKAFFFKKKLIPVGYSSYTLKGKNPDEIYAILHNCGFKYIRRTELKDIYINSPYSENEVDHVEINGQSQFDANSEFPYDAQIVITIHQKKEITIPFSASSLRKLNFNEACSRLSALGFTEIYTTPIKDLVTGWITKDGSVEKVVIGSGNGETFKKNAVYKYDVSIIIHYHTFNK